MIPLRIPYLTLVALTLVACGREAEDSAPAAATEAETATKTPAQWTPITPGLDMRIIETGAGETAAAGQVVTVHYTGWLYDSEAPDGRGNKFDSSVDRGQYFEFPLGAGRVIRGWDQGVVGMKIGETRELRIAPEMAYGDRQVGALIPPGSTLLFEVELAGLDGNIPNEP